MNDHRPQVDMPRPNVTPDEQARMPADGGACLPAWNRERLFRQLQEIDGSSRSEAERQIDGFEQGFWNARGGAPIAGGAGGDTGKWTTIRQSAVLSSVAFSPGCRGKA